LPKAPPIYHCGFPECGMTTYYPIFYETTPVCPSCNEKIQKDPDLLETLKEKAFPPILPQKVKEWKPPEKWEYREGRMHVKESNMDLQVLELLQERGHKVRYQEPIVLVQTIPEYFVDGKAYFYNDFEETHKGKEDRDDELRDLLAKHTGKPVYGIGYDSVSKKTAKEIADFIEAKVQ